MSEKHNGWTNYETWKLASEIENTESQYLYWGFAASEAYASSPNLARGRLGQRLQSEHPSASYRINWLEIADSMLEERGDQ